MNSSPVAGSSDEAGRFQFPVTKADAFRIEVTRDGFATENTWIKDYTQELIVKLRPLSVIHGRVLNEDGEPVPGMTVQVLRVFTQNGRRVSRVIAWNTTDDLGEYRTWNLDAGRYYVKMVGHSRSGESVQLSTIAGSAIRETYGPVYHPNAASLDAATVIELGAGQRVRADFNVTPHESHRVQGAIRNLPPYARASIRVLRGSEELSSSTIVDPSSGAFTISDLPPGPCTLQAYTAGAEGNRMGEAEIIIPMRPGTKADIVLASGVELKGTIQLPSNSPTRFPLSLVSTTPNRHPFSDSIRYAVVGADGRFTFANLFPGVYSLGMVGIPNGYIVAIGSSEGDLMANGIRIGQTPPEPVTIEMASGGSSVEGRVEGLQTGASVKVAAIRNASAALPPTLSYVRDGKFVFKNLAPGSYTFYAWPERLDIAYAEPLVMAAYAEYGSTVSVADGETVPVKLRAIPGETP